MKLIVVNLTGIPKESKTILHETTELAAEHGIEHYGYGQFEVKKYTQWIKTLAGIKHKRLMAMKLRWNKHKSKKIKC